MKYVAPRVGESSFNCPWCGAFAHMKWELLLSGGREIVQEVGTALCTHCQQRSVWHVTQRNQNINPVAGNMVFPKVVTAPSPHSDMPADVLSDFSEARNISSDSPRAACALLRLCIQKLCKHLGQPGKNINDDIGALVKSGLPVTIQQALDIVRVVGNNAVHPGELSAADVATVSETLFALVNMIVEDQIAKPKQLNALFASLPQGALTGIAKRDNVP